jgi:hypothetical protein
MPDPLLLVVKNGIKILLSASSSIPFPVSVTSRIILPYSSMNALRTICLVMASLNYDERDYIRDYKEYLMFKHNKLV